jgi:hypothetical protein
VQDPWVVPFIIAPLQGIKFSMQLGLLRPTSATRSVHCREVGKVPIPGSTDSTVIMISTENTLRQGRLLTSRM